MDVGHGDFGASGGVERELLDFLRQLAQVGAHRRHQFAESFIRHLLPARPQFASDESLRPIRPVLVVGGQSGEVLDGPEFLDGFREGFPAVDFSGGDEQANVVPREALEFLGQVVQGHGDGLGAGDAFVSQEIALAQPDDFAAAEEGEGLERLAESGQGPQRLLAVRDRGVNGLMVHPANLLAPVRIQLPTPLLHGEIVLAAHEHQGCRGLAHGCFHRMPAPARMGPRFGASGAAVVTTR